MKEIKFRAWDGSKMWSWEDITKDKEILCSVMRNEFYATIPPKYFWQRQQYTGLKDKNGVEIYEGDLLTYADNITTEQIFEVKFLDERGVFVFRELYNPTFEGSDLPGWDDVIFGQNAWDGWEIADAAKVIGNIFEGVDK